MTGGWRGIGMEVYPRVCGGTEGRYPCPSTAPGLSPRVRGNPATAVPGVGVDRSIPACAGEPAVMLARPAKNAVYPRRAR